MLLAPGSVRDFDWAGRLVRFDVGRREIEGDRMHRDVILMGSRSNGTHIDA